MTLQEVQKQALQLPNSERWRLDIIYFRVLKTGNSSKVEAGNRCQLQGIAKSSIAVGKFDSQEDSVIYLVENYQ